MGSLNRKLQRNVQKVAYKKFCKSWGNEKAYQKYVVEDLGEELEQPRLKNKPTFSQWLEMVEKMKVKVKERDSNVDLDVLRTHPEDTDSIPDLDWNEDT